VKPLATSLVLLFVTALLDPSRASPFEDRESRAATVRVASYNAWLLPIGADQMEERRDRMGSALDELEPDVVCLQEVWTVQALAPVAESLSERLPHVATGGGGLVLLSRWPLRERSFQAFPASTASSLAERFARKGWLSAVVDTPAGPLRVVNSHLTFTRSDDRSSHDAQLALLVETLRDQTDVPTILCADLNLRAFEAGAPTRGFALLLEAGFEDAAANGAGPVRAGTRVGWPRAGRTARWDPDYLLFRQGDAGALSLAAFRQALDTDETALSDHNLQLADFVLEAR
jgi:endonuclease/exonuclease/phosphatase family metal-dependent hydrolase